MKETGLNEIKKREASVTDAEKEASRDRFEFTAATPKDDMIMGLCFPAGLMFIALATIEIHFYMGILNSVKSSSALFKILVFAPEICITYIFMRNLHRIAANKFLVNLDGLSMNVKKNGKEIMEGEILSCKIKTSRGMLVQVVEVDIKTSGDKISFRARPKEYKTITGNTSFNMFGTSDISDMEELLALGREIKSRIEK